MKTIAFFLLSVCWFNAHAHHQLRGSVKNQADKSNIAYATVALLHPDSSIITGVTTNDDGRFVIDKVNAGDYLVQVSFIGYKKEYRPINVPINNDLGDIYLEESANKLEEVIIKADRPFVEQRSDRYIVNVSSHIQSSGRNALDLLANTPGVLVGPGGAVSVMGNNVEIWVDGRPSRMSGEQLQALLNSTQAESIDRIEVITNPSSRYEASGSGGIINVRTKKGLQYGFNGSVDAGYRQGRKNRENAGLNLNYRKEFMNLFGSYNISENRNWEKIEQVNKLQTSDGLVTFDQNSEANSVNATLSQQYKVGMDFFVNKENTIGVLFNGYHNGKGKMNFMGRTDITPALDGTSYSTAENRMSSVSDGNQLNLNYQGLFSEKQLNIDFDYAKFVSDPFQHNTNKYFDLDNIIIGEPEQLRNSNPQTITVLSAKADYIQPLWDKARMEIGGKISKSETDNDLFYEEYKVTGWETDFNQSNHFLYKERIDAAYINLNQSLEKWNFQAGLRGEYIWSEGNQKTTEVVNDTSYFNLFPTLFINYRPSGTHTFGLSYSRRLNRPNYGQLNPFEVKIDAYSFLSGNPYLTPAYTHNIQFSYSFKQNLMARLSYSKTTDLIMRTPVEDAANNRYGMTYANFGESQKVVLMANYRTSLTKFWNINLMAQGAYTNNRSMESSGEFVNDGVSYVIHISNNITITPTLSAEITGLYVSSMQMGYFELKPQGNLSAGLRQSLFKNKLTVSLTVNDIIYTSKDKGVAKYNGVDYQLTNERDSRWVNLAIRYSFGSDKVKASRRHKSGIEDETSRAR